MGFTFFNPLLAVQTFIAGHIAIVWMNLIHRSPCPPCSDRPPALRLCSPASAWLGPPTLGCRFRPRSFDVRAESGTRRRIRRMPTITPFLWYDTQAEEAVSYY